MGKIPAPFRRRNPKTGHDRIETGTICIQARKTRKGKRKKGSDMPNGGHVCCAECEFADFPAGHCSIYGTPISGMLLCRHFRIYRNDRKPHEQWPMLASLEPGYIYEIDNSMYKSGEPRPRFRVRIVDAAEK
jgi:hypothetical protein